MTDEDNSTEDLLARARDGDAEARGQLFERFGNYLRLLAHIQLNRQLARKESESDIVQQTFLAGTRDFDSFQGQTEAEFAAWLRSILAHSVSEVVRRYKKTSARQIGLERSIHDDLDRSSADLCRGLVSPQSSPSEQVMREERARLLADALAQLPDHYREVIVLRNLEGKSFPEIAHETGRSLDSVKNQWIRAFDQLRKYLESMQ